MKQLFRDFLFAGSVFSMLCLSSTSIFAQDTSASAFIVIDHHSGHVLKEFNATKKLQVASLTKIATAVVVLDWAQAMGQNLEQIAVVPTLKPGVANTQGISWAPGDRASLKDLLWAALLQSDNVAAETLASHVGKAISADPDPAMHVVSFVAQMNALARKLEMSNTRFLNPQGLDTLERKLPYSTAEDMAKLTAYAMSNPGFLFFVSQRERRISATRGNGSKLDYKLVNTNQLVGKASVDGVKTGTTKRAGECVIISAARSPESRKEGETFFVTPRRLEVVILGSSNRFPEALTLLNEGWAEHESWVSSGRPESPRPVRKKSFVNF